jgi:hypothetical protein
VTVVGAAGGGWHSLREFFVHHGVTLQSVRDWLYVKPSTDPNQSIQLARQGLARFPRGARAAELERNVVKALCDMGRLDERKDRARDHGPELPGQRLHPRRRTPRVLNPPPNE